LGVHRQHEHTRRQALLRDLLRGVKPAHHWHGEVHDDHVRPQPLGNLDSLAAVGGLADDLHIWLVVEQGSQTRPQNGVVVHEDDPNLSFAQTATAAPTCPQVVTGTPMRIVVPAPGLVSILKVPPTSSTRSRIPKRPRPRSRLLVASSRSNPTPLSCTVTSTPVSENPMRTRTCEALAWRAMFVSASWTTR